MNIQMITTALALLSSSLTLTACGDDSGACVSDSVDYKYFVRTYCYDNWDRSDCDEHNDQPVNGTNWTFHAGETCEDRGLHSGGN